MNKGKSTPSIDGAIEKFRDAAAARGIKLPPRIEADGKLHRCGTDDGGKDAATRANGRDAHIDINGAGSQIATPCEIATLEPAQSVFPQKRTPVTTAEPDLGNAELVLSLYHSVSEGASGAFVLSYTPSKVKEAGKRPLNVQRFAIGASAAMAAEARGRARHANVYFGPALMRKGLKPGERGKETDIQAVLALILEEDADTGKFVTLPDGMTPTFEIETSHRPWQNRHFHWVFDRPLPAKKAKELALLAHRKCGGDTGGKDVTHVWRVPETLNHPDWRKIERGRPEEPQPVRLIGGTLEPVNVEELRAALEAMPDLYPELKPGDGAEWQAGGSEDVAGIMERLKAAVRNRIGQEGKDRSAHCFSTLLSLFEAGLTDAEALLVADKAPFAAKFWERGDLDNEISRVRLQWTRKGNKQAPKPKAATLDATSAVISGSAEPVEEQRLQDAEIDTLARMNVIDFDKARKEKAAALEVTAGALNKAVAERRKQLKAEARASADDGDGKKGTQADTLLRLAQDAATFFSVPGDDAAYAVVQLKGHRETWPLKSLGFKRWLINQYLNETERSPNSDALNQALATIDAISCGEDGEKRPVFKRRAEHEGKIYLDLCDDAWRAIEIGASGWRIVDEPPVHFIRSRGMLPLPIPVRGGDINELRKFVNVDDEAGFKLLVAFLLAACHPTGPYSVLALIGEPGTAKTTTARLLRDFFDPNSANLRRAPKTEEDLFIQASNAACLVYDNLSGIPEWLSDALCVIATGGSYSKRQHYTDSEETILTAIRPVILTSTSEVVAKSDLVNRALIISLKVIPDDKRMSERKFNAALDEARPRILGALLDAAVHGVKTLPSLEDLEDLPRMADFITWTRACEGALWGEGDIQAAFKVNADDAVDAVLEGDHVATALRAFIEQEPGGYWKGSGETLLTLLTARAPLGVINKKDMWPQHATQLGNRLSLAAPPLRKRGVTVTRGRESGGSSHGKRTRFVEIVMAPEKGDVAC
ncbi:MAG: hypothetical protein WBX25_12615 [Rhodomicrobium sp.]